MKPRTLQDRWKQNRENEEFFNSLNQYSNQIVKQEQIQKAQEDEEKLGYWQKVGHGALGVLSLNPLGSTFLNTQDAYFIEDGKYKKQKVIGGSVPLPWSKEVSEQEYVEGYQKAQKKYDKMTPFERRLRSVGTIIPKVIKGGVAEVSLGLLNEGADLLFNNYSYEDKAINKLQKELVDPRVSKERKEELNKLYQTYISKRWDEKIEDNVNNWWNNSFVGQHFKTNNAKDIAKRVANHTNNLSKIYAEYGDEINKNPFEALNDKMASRNALISEFENTVKNSVRHKEGKATQLIDDSKLEPLSKEKVKDRFGKEWNLEKTETGSLWDKKTIIRDENGLAVLDPLTGEPEYDRNYSVGRKVWETAKGLATTEVGHDAIVEGVTSVAQFAIPGTVIGGMAGKLSSGIAEATNMGAQMTKVANFGSKLATAAITNQIESSQVGEQTFNEVYNEKLAEYSKIDKNKIIEELSGTGLTPDQTLLMSEARYKRKLQEWAEANPEEASMAYGQAKAAGNMAEDTNRLLIPLQVYEIGLLTRAAKGLKGAKTATSASRNLLESTKTPLGRLKTIGKIGYEGSTEYFEETFNNYAAEKGKHLAIGENYTWADFDMTSAESIESGMLGFILGAGMSGLTVAMDNKAKNKAYKDQQKFVEDLKKLPGAVKNSVLKDIITGLNVEDALIQAKEIEQAINEKDGGKAKALGEKLLVSRVAQSLQQGTAGEFMNVLLQIMDDENLPEDSKKEVKKAVDFTYEMANYYDSLAPHKQKNPHYLINYGNLLQINDAITEVESKMPKIREGAREYEENQIRLNNEGASNIDEIIAEQIEGAIDKNISVVTAKEQLDNLKFIKAKALQQEENLHSEEYQEMVQKAVDTKKVKEIIKTTNRANIEDNIVAIETIQEAPLTQEQEAELENTINPEPVRVEEPRTEAEQLDNEGVIQNIKDKKLIEEINNAII